MLVGDTLPDSMLTTAQTVVRTAITNKRPVVLHASGIIFSSYDTSSQQWISYKELLLFAIYSMTN